MSAKNAAVARVLKARRAERRIIVNERIKQYPNLCFYFVLFDF